MYLARVSDLDQVTKERDEQRKNVDTLRKARLSEFMSGFALITTKLKELYQMITLGGDAELELVDSLDPFSEGIVFSVRPPKKTWKNISNLSGGEKTLSSLALVFALHYYKPTPLYVMDEIDAALDFKNVATTSRSAPVTPSSSSSRYVPTCSNWLTGWSASTRRTTAPSPSPSIRPPSKTTSTRKTAIPPPIPLPLLFCSFRRLLLHKYSPSNSTNTILFVLLNKLPIHLAYSVQRHLLVEWSFFPCNSS